MSFATAVARLTGWLPIEPYWPVTNGDGMDEHVIPDDHIEARIRDEHVAVPDWAQPGLADRWTQEWTSFSVAVPGSDEGLPIVVMGGATHLRRRVEGGSSLQLVPTYWVYSALSELVVKTSEKNA
ncbi:hypothetical protein BFL36_14325 [Clavibacter michiganensis]|uniref:Uncharacterized protein n=1 Tax=Clavibacter michiganensis TaxID=28447 RepID=A0A251Y238_9MICO|nr:hypothetical protein [Clavibacter michiganensis]OUE18325.1 hypothetical protein BFL36_14325 [Clavibacter michiganensis]